MVVGGAAAYHQPDDDVGVPQLIGAGGAAARHNPDFAVAIAAKIGIFQGAQLKLPN